jgi:RES domain-containing protein
MLEYFVHVDRDDPPGDLVLATAQIPDGLTRMEVNASHLPAHWRDAPAPPELAAIGDEFVLRGRATILIVPSALAPTESNWLMNPLHPGFSKIKVKPIEEFRYDSRFFRS